MKKLIAASLVLLTFTATACARGTWADFEACLDERVYPLSAETIEFIVDRVHEYRKTRERPVYMANAIVECAKVMPSGSWRGTSR